MSRRSRTRADRWCRLLEIYREATGERDAKPVSIRGAPTRIFGAVSFGPSRPGRPYRGHAPDEYIDLDTIDLANRTVSRRASVGRPPALRPVSEVARHRRRRGLSGEAPRFAGPRRVCPLQCVRHRSRRARRRCRPRGSSRARAARSHLHRAFGMCRAHAQTTRRRRFMRLATRASAGFERPMGGR